MSGILGALNLSEAAAERTYINTLGQEEVFDIVQQEIEKYNRELQSIMALFVEKPTTNFKKRFILPGGGYLQPMGEHAQPDAVKAFGKWDVAFPLVDFGAQVSQNRVQIAYMTAAQLNVHLDTVFMQDVNTVRREIMKALLDNGGGSPISFEDPIHGTLSVQPLANGDSVFYPPVLGSDTEAQENHYIETGYVPADISDTNNPCEKIRDELEEHFGTPTGGSSIVMLTTKAICDACEENLTDFDPVINRYIQPGSNTDIPIGVPEGTPGRVRGICNGVWVVEWRSMPANYAIGIHADAQRPLEMRVDPEDTGLGRGLQLVAEDEEFPFKNSFWSHRFGMAVANRLNGVILEFGTGGTYTVPAGYSH